jgi:hypothetical protein
VDLSGMLQVLWELLQRRIPPATCVAECLPNARRMPAECLKKEFTELLHGTLRINCNTNGLTWIPSVLFRSRFCSEYISEYIPGLTLLYLKHSPALPNAAEWISASSLQVAGSRKRGRKRSHLAYCISCA